MSLGRLITPEHLPNNSLQHSIQHRVNFLFHETAVKHLSTIYFTLHGENITLSLINLACSKEYKVLPAGLIISNHTVLLYIQMGKEMCQQMFQ